MADVDISPSPNTFNFLTAKYEYIKKLEYKYIFQNWRNLWIQLFPDTKFCQNPYESIYDLESEYISFFAIEYEYNYLVRDMDLGP